ncbi:competence protein CoiA family protein [Massilia timonae]|uniref:competence protein CoiA family protein n=1 Tax=Massilia timonae TaxID=47229 RepID=UPI002899E65C|nr:competence protein CoiA family protein [Massilia timonae]
MPLSANSPSGPFSLIGLDASTLEQLKARNRSEALFTARCCGRPVQIRTPARKTPHFYHLAGAPGCSGGGKESAEHLGMKAAIGAAALVAGWQAEAEAEQRRPDGTLEWRADILARRGRARIAFEVQLSNPDWTGMHERQLRYRASGVRGMWFVRTAKPFPQQTSHAMPVFRVSGPPDRRMVHLAAPADWDVVWQHCQESVPLADFVERALTRRLNWAPLRDSWMQAKALVSVRLTAYGRCWCCGFNLGKPYALTMRPLLPQAYPQFSWHQGMGRQVRSAWVDPLAALALRAAGQKTRVGTIDLAAKACSVCGADATELDTGESFPSVEATVALDSLPAPAPSSVEWQWLYRWVLG